jgi:hypothetical protein
MTPRAPIVHRDGTVTYWSVHSQCYRERVRYVSTGDLAAMNARDRRRVLRALPPTYCDETAHFRGES